MGQNASNSFTNYKRNDFKEIIELTADKIIIFVWLKGRGGGGSSLIFFMKLVSEIAVDQQTRLGLGLG